VTFKDLQKVIESESGSSKTAESNQILQKLRGKPFWYWKDADYHKQKDRINKGQCCFNHFISLPKKNGIADLLDHAMHLVLAERKKKEG
jgi:hypothetical protein